MATRHERVIVDLDDRFSRPMAGMAASTAMFRKSLDDSGRSVVAFDKTTRDTAPSIDKLSGRLAILTRAAAVLGPGLVPITTAAIPAIAGLSTQLGFAAAGAGTAVLAFKGVGDALQAVNKYQLDPSQANFEKLQETLRGLGPAAREFVFFLDSIGPQLQSLREAAQEGLLPGAQEGLESLMTRLPQVRDIIAEVADSVGDLMADSGESLASSRWDDFFNFLESEARPALTTLGQTAGNVAHGIAELFMALNPMSDDFTEGLLNASRAFDEWASGLSQTEGFQDFLAYVRETGPQVLDTLGSLANMLLQVVEAMAPMGGPVLSALEAVADVISTIANSPIGTPLLAAAGAMSALSLATNGFGKAMDSAAVGKVRGMTADLRTMGREGIVAWGRSAEGAQRYAAASGRVSTSLRSMGRQAAVIGGLTLATSGLADKTGFANTATMALMGTIAGPWGAAIGGGVGLAMDFAAANNDLADAINRADSAIDTGNLASMRAELVALQEQLGRTQGSGGLGELSSWLSGDINKAEDRIGDLRAAIRDAQNATGGLGSVFGSALGPGLGMTAGAFETAAQSADEFRSSLQQVNAALTGRASFRDYQAALDDFSASVRENGRRFGEMTAAGRANNAALDNIASTALKVGENLRGMDRVNFLQRARGQFIAAARDMGVPRAAAARLADELGLVNRMRPKPKVDADTKNADKKLDNTKKKAQDVGKQRPKPKADADTRGADGKIDRTHGKVRALDKATAHPKLIADDLVSGAVARAQAAINAMHGKTIVIRTQHMNERLERSADGGSVPKTGLPYADRHLYLLADGEEIISNRHGQADRFRADRAAGRIPGYADGGTTGKTAKERREDAKDRREAARDRAEDRRTRARNRRNAMFQFDLAADMGVKGVAREFNSLRNSLKLSGNALGGLEKRAKRVTASYLRHESALKAAQKTLADLRQSRSQLRSGVQSEFTSDRFGSGLFGLQTFLRKDTTRASDMLAAVKGADTKGINKALLGDLVASGDLRTAQQIAGLSTAEVKALSRQYTATTGTIDKLASYSSQAVYGKAIADQSQLIRTQTATLRTLNRQIERLEKRAQNIHIHGVTNPRHVAREVARHQARSGKD